MTFKHYISLLALIVLSLARVSAQEADSVAEMPRQAIRVSVLTCTPGADVYAKFGHTALRVHDPNTGYDTVFNYGCFNYSSDNFVMKFILGQTDYMLEAEHTEMFMERYHWMGNGVTEQLLSLSDDETRRLCELLSENLQPENQEYRYSWLYDNCTERARDMIEKAVSGKVAYNRAEEEGLTVRMLLHECLGQTPWLSFGIDLLLGSEIDQPADRRVRMFLPDVFMAEADEASIVRENGENEPYVTSKIVLFEPTYIEPKPLALTPNVVFGTLLAIALMFSIYDIKRRKLSVWLDIVLTTAQGLAGVLITFLFRFSAHPSVDTNWLVILFNPLFLVYAGWMVRCIAKRKRNKLAIANLAVTALFVPTMLLCPQAFNTATYMIAYTLLARAITQNIINKI